MTEARKHHDRDADHGPRISGAEYDRRIVELHSGAGADAGEAAIRRGELEITIDHRLGIRFPPERRESLWAAQQQVAARPLLAGIGHLLGRALRGRRPSLSGAQAAYLVERYSQVLDDAELSQYFDIPPEAIRELLSR